MRPEIYLDVDGVLLGRPSLGSSEYKLANHGLAFLEFVTDAFEVSWATTHCRAGDADHAVTYLADHADEGEREQVVLLARRIRPTAFNVMKTEILVSKPDHSWIWLDDSPMQAELSLLELRGWSNRLLRVDTCAEPDGLLRVRSVLEALR